MYQQFKTQIITQINIATDYYSQQRMYIVSYITGFAFVK